MPIYEFDCRGCGARFEELTGPDRTPACPTCGSDDIERRISLVAPRLKIGPRGRDARRMEAKRYDRRERETERKRANRKDT